MGWQLAAIAVEAPTTGTSAVVSPTSYHGQRSRASFKISGGERQSLQEPPRTLAGRPLGPLGLGSGLLGPRVKYTPVVMMILTFGQLYFVIP
jgi:hypothetical protein